jgi:hypothetical protein
MTGERAPAAQVDLATWRLDRALGQLEARVARRLATAEAGLTALAACEDRAKELEAAAAAAALALDRAISEVQSALKVEGA